MSLRRVLFVYQSMNDSFPNAFSPQLSVYSCCQRADSWSCRTLQVQAMARRVLRTTLLVIFAVGAETAAYNSGAVCSGYSHRWRATSSSVVNTTIIDTGSSSLLANATMLNNTASWFNATSGTFFISSTSNGASGYMNIDTFNVR